MQAKLFVRESQSIKETRMLENEGVMVTGLLMLVESVVFKVPHQNRCNLESINVGGPWGAGLRES